MCHALLTCPDTRELLGSFHFDCFKSGCCGICGQVFEWMQVSISPGSVCHPSVHPSILLFFCLAVQIHRAANPWEPPRCTLKAQLHFLIPAAGPGPHLSHHLADVCCPPVSPQTAQASGSGLDLHFPNVPLMRCCIFPRACWLSVPPLCRNVCLSFACFSVGLFVFILLSFKRSFYILDSTYTLHKIDDLQIRSLILLSCLYFCLCHID